MRVASDTFNSEARLSWVLAVLAGVLGATAYTHSEGYFVTFMTGNAQRAVLGYFSHSAWLSVSAGLFEVVSLVGRARVRERLEAAVRLVAAPSAR